MFTIRWIAANGSEMIYPATDVSFTPAAPEEGVRKAVVAFNTDNVHCTIDHGRLFVMNAAGKTVATYILEGDRDYPHGLANAA